MRSMVHPRVARATMLGQSATLRRAAALAAVAIGASLTASQALARDPQFLEYYVGRDLRQTIPTGSAFTGLPNPNYNRLTLLFAHTYPDAPLSNHYHSKSTYTYTGTNLGAATAVQPFNGNAAGVPGNYLPETAGGRIQLLPGSGAFSGKFVSGVNESAEFSLLTIGSVDALAAAAGASQPVSVLFNSGGTAPAGRWTGSLAGSNLSLQVVSLSAGLTVADAGGNTLLDGVGDVVALGAGDASLNFKPVFVAPATATRADYSVTFKLVDNGTANAGGPWLESGQFTYNVTVPEPTSLLALGAATLGGLVRRRRA